MLYDIYELLKKENKGDEIETLQDLKDLNDESKEWDDEFWDFINKKAIEQEICPRCLIGLEKKFIAKERYEIYGKEVVEDIFEYRCPKCGYIYE